MTACFQHPFFCSAARDNVPLFSFLRCFFQKTGAAVCEMLILSTRPSQAALIAFCVHFLSSEDKYGSFLQRNVPAHLPNVQYPYRFCKRSWQTDGVNYAEKPCFAPHLHICRVFSSPPRFDGGSDSSRFPYEIFRRKRFFMPCVLLQFPA